MTVNDDVTVCLKAFERPACLRRAVQSVRDYYPDVHILVADDSHNPVLVPGVDEWLFLPFDTGLSFGRNRMVEHVKTKYMFLMEDDAYFYENTRLEEQLEVMEQTDIDILGITVVDTPDMYVHPNGYLIFIRGETGYSVLGYHDEIAGCYVCDLVENIFMARTASLQAFEGWDEALKIHEHGDFFLRAKGQLKVAFMPWPRILHEHIDDARYVSFRRGRSKKFAAMFFAKYGVTSWNSDGMGVPKWAEKSRSS